jgi:hypothetical protein
MPAPAGLRFRAAAPGDANAIAALHADSWQRNYRDAFLDHDVAGYLLPLWTERPDPRARTILAETGGTVVGLAHTLLGGAKAWAMHQGFGFILVNGRPLRQSSIHISSLRCAYLVSE